MTAPDPANLPVPMPQTGSLVVAPAAALLPAPLFAPTPKAAQRFVEFFIAQINNDHTRQAYLNATRRFGHWCETHGLAQLPTCSRFMSRRS